MSRQKIMLLGTILAISLLGGAIWWITMGTQPKESFVTPKTPTQQQPPSPTAPVETKEAEPIKDSSPATIDTTQSSSLTSHLAPGTYTTYDQARLADANNGTVVLFFHAPWCPTCIAANADIESRLADVPSGLTILKTDYDSSKDLKRKYGVTYQHTFVQVDAQGNQLQKWSGGGLNSIIEMVGLK